VTAPPIPISFSIPSSRPEQRRVCRGGAEDRGKISTYSRVAFVGSPTVAGRFFTLRAPALHIFSGASIPKSPTPTPTASLPIRSIQ